MCSRSDRDKARSRAGSHRDREGARRRAGSRSSTWSATPSGWSSRTRASTRVFVVLDHVHPRPRGVGPRARARPLSGKESPSPTGRPPAGSAKMFKVMAPYQPAPPPSSVRLGRREARPQGLLGEWFEPTSKSMSRRCACRLVSLLGALRRATGRRRPSSRRSATGAKSRTETGSSSSRRTTPTTARSRIRASVCSCSGRAEPAKCEVNPFPLAPAKDKTDNLTWRRVRRRALE